MVGKDDDPPHARITGGLFTGFKEHTLLQYPLLSTSFKEKRIGQWIKTADNSYTILHE